MQSISKTRNEQLLPLISEALNDSKEDTVKILALDALGQINNKESFNLIKSIPFSKQSHAVKRAMIRNLARFTNEESLNILQSIRKRGADKVALMRAFGILAKKGIKSAEIKLAYLDSSAISNPTSEIASFALFYLGKNDAGSLIRMLSFSKSTLEKDILKALEKLYRTAKPQLVYYLKSDSTGRAALANSILRILDRENDSAKLNYALKLAPLVADSTFLPPVEHLILNDNS